MMDLYNGLHLRGRVKCFYNARRFGFITAQGKDYFVHDSDSKLSLKEGQLVDFIVNHDKRGRPQAKRVRLVKNDISKRNTNETRVRPVIDEAVSSGSESSSEESDDSESPASNTDRHRCSNTSSDDDISNVEQFDIHCKNMIGSISSYNARKGFGFILKDEDKRNIFFHKNNCLPFDHRNQLSPGCYVKFDVAKSAKKTALEAINVVNISSLNKDDSRSPKSETSEIDKSQERSTTSNEDLNDGVVTGELAGEDSVNIEWASADVVSEALENDLKWIVRMKSDILDYPNEENEVDPFNYLAHSNAFCGPENRVRRKENKDDQRGVGVSKEVNDKSEPYQKLSNQGRPRSPEAQIDKPADDCRKAKRRRSRPVKTSGDASEATPTSYSALSAQKHERIPKSTSVSAEESVRRKPTADVSGLERRVSSRTEQASPPATTSTTTSDHSGPRYSALGGLATSRPKPTADVSGLERRVSSRTEQASPPATTSTTTSAYSGPRYSALGGLATSRPKPTADVSGLERRVSSRTEQASPPATTSTTTSAYSGPRYSALGGLATSRPKPTADVSGLERRVSSRTEQASPPATTSTTTSAYSGPRYSALGGLATSRPKPTADVSGLERRVSSRTEQASPPATTSTTTSAYSGPRYSALGGLATSRPKPTVDSGGLERRLSSRAEQASPQTVSSSTSYHSGLRSAVTRGDVTEASQTKPTADRSSLQRRLSSRAEQKSSETASTSTDNSGLQYSARRISAPETSQTKTAVVHPLNNDIDQLEKNYKTYLDLGDNSTKKTTETTSTEIEPPSTTLVCAVRGTIVKSPQFSQSGEIKTLSHGIVSLPMRACHQYMGSSQLKPGTKIVFDLVYSGLNKDNIAVNIKTIHKNDSSCVVC